MKNDNLLSVEHLSVVLADQSQRSIVDDVSFSVASSTILALVGGSGSGKTTTGLSILNLLPWGLSLKGGSVFLKGEDFALVTPERMRQIRGGEIGMVFQDSLQAFNPVLTIGYQIEEVLKCHTRLGPAEIRARMEDLLIQTGLGDPRRVLSSYPHQLSGGMRQRAMIAQAIAASPSLLIADEPTSSLDVTLQAKILELFEKLRDQLKLSIILITHDLGIVRHVADQVVILNEGRVVESGVAKDIIAAPAHEYSKRLISTLRN